VGQYDLAVIGSDLGGLASAALLGMRRKKSFLCTHQSSLADALGKVQQGGFSFSRGPALSYGFESGGAFHELFSDLSITDIMPPLADGYQIALPDRRITVSARLDATLEELRREFPREINEIANFYHDMKKVSMGLAKRRLDTFILRFRSARSFIAKYHFSKEFLALLDIQALFFFQQPLLELSLKDLLLLCTHNPYRNEDGFMKIADRLAAMILRQGGAIRYNAQSTEILFRKNRVVGLHTTQGAVEASSILVDNPEKSTPVFYLGIHDQVVPVGMERDVLYLPDYSEPQSFLSLSLSSKEDRTAAPQGMRTLTAAFHAPKGGAVASRNLLINRMSGLVPFLSDFIVLSHESGSLLSPVVPKEISFKPLKTGKSDSLLFRGSKRNVYQLRELQGAPQQMISAVRKLTSKLA